MDKLLASELGEMRFIVLLLFFFMTTRPPYLQCYTSACTRRLSSLHVTFITYILVPEIALDEFCCKS